MEGYEQNEYGSGSQKQEILANTRYETGLWNVYGKEASYTPFAGRQSHLAQGKEAGHVHTGLHGEPDNSSEEKEIPSNSSSTSTGADGADEM